MSYEEEDTCHMRRRTYMLNVEHQVCFAIHADMYV